MRPANLSTHARTASVFRALYRDSAAEEVLGTEKGFLRPMRPISVPDALFARATLHPVAGGLTRRPRAMMIGGRSWYEGKLGPSTFPGGQRVGSPCPYRKWVALSVLFLLPPHGFRSAPSAPRLGGGVRRGKA
jgi:hypothetical protein